MINIPILIQYVALLTMVVGVIAYIFKTYRDTTSNYDQDTIVRLKESNETLRQENIDLKSRLAAIELRVKSVEKDNEVLKSVLAGKDTIDKFQRTLNQFLPYIDALEEFRKHDELIIKKLNELLGAKDGKSKTTP